MKLISLLILGLLGISVQGQFQAPSNFYSDYIRSAKDTLASPFFHGRGYLKDGQKLSAYHIATEFVKLGLKNFSPAPSYYQSFEMPVNIFAQHPTLAFDQDFLTCGVDYLPHPSCPSIQGNFQLLWIDTTYFQEPKKFKSISKRDLRRTFLVMDLPKPLPRKLKDVVENFKKNPFNAAGFIELEENLVWGVATQASRFGILQVKRGAIGPHHKELRASISSTHMPNFPNANVIGYIPGKEVRDTFILVTSHYDHLGKIGPHITFPGANDNASGVASMLGLAHYFSQPENQPKYSVAFIAFSGEEAGLLGSIHYIRNPIVPFPKTRFVLNLDIMGSEDLITMVNAKEQSNAFKLLDSLNLTLGAVQKIRARGQAANSDHYYFSQLGIPAVFLYTEGSVKGYHSIFDTAEKTPMAKAGEIHELLVRFLNSLQTRSWKPQRMGN
ncbi:MAG: M28 family peptidase [Bacteroidetes bacterium]|nr:M28 family peptidase [Bacteroidota bacterium]